MKFPIWDNIFPKPTEESETVLALKGVPIFQELDNTELKEIERLVHQREYTPGERIFSQGQPGLGMYILQSGKVKIYQEEQGEQIELARLSRGNFFGDMSLLDEAPRSATAEALELSRVIAFFRPDLMDLLDRQPRTGIKVIKGVAGVMAVRLRAQNDVSRELHEQVSALQREIDQLKSQLNNQSS
ncbi:MAG TPA: cyclic nucleotide-binding domain-containing protein [bacterium]|nr:cyclic nucleotide-binding domain-containing protein [bacterium]